MKFMDFQNLPFFNLFFFSLSLWFDTFFDTIFYDFPGGSNGKESACSAGDVGSIPGLGRSPGEGNDDPLQFSFLENAMDRGAWQSMGS